MSDSAQKLTDADSYNSLIAEVRTLTPEAVLRLREIVHLIKSGRFILSPPKRPVSLNTYDCSDCDFSMCFSMFGQCDRHKREWEEGYSR